MGYAVSLRIIKAFEKESVYKSVTGLSWTVSSTFPTVMENIKLLEKIGYLKTKMVYNRIHVESTDKLKKILPFIDELLKLK